MNTTLLIIRHGQVDNPTDLIYHRAIDVKLSIAGVAQMKTVGEKLLELHYNPTTIYTSPLTRTMETVAEIAKSYPEIPIIKNEDIIESNAPGLEEVTNKWIEEAYKRGYDEYNDPKYKGIIEAPLAIAARMKRAIYKIVDKHRGETVIAVSHGDPIAFLKLALLHPEIAPSGHKDFEHISPPEKGSVWEIVLDSDKHLVSQKVVL